MPSSNIAGRKNKYAYALFPMKMGRDVVQHFALTSDFQVNTVLQRLVSSRQLVRSVAFVASVIVTVDLQNTYVSIQLQAVGRGRL